jgi:heme A synthase
MALIAHLKVETKFKPPHPGFVRFAWSVVAWNLAVALSGAYVRATGSGAGCGNHWPLCNGRVTPQSSNIHTIIEFTHRAMTGLDTPLVAWLLIWAFRAFPRRHPVRLAAVLSAAFLATEALLGAVLVKSQHVAANADPFLNSFHLVNTLTLLACLTITAWWGMGKPVAQLRGMAAWMAALSLAAVMVLGITGAISALGDTLFPASSLAAGLAQDFDPASSVLLHLRALHPVIAAAVGGWLTFYAVGRLRTAKAVALSVIVMVWIQLLAGLVNFLLQAPVWMQMIHLLAAYLLWISLVLLCASASPAPNSAQPASLTA